MWGSTLKCMLSMHFKNWLSKWLNFFVPIPTVSWCPLRHSPRFLDQTLRPFQAKPQGSGWSLSRTWLTETHVFVIVCHRFSKSVPNLSLEPVIPPLWRSFRAFFSRLRTPKRSGSRQATRLLLAQRVGSCLKTVAKTRDVDGFGPKLINHWYPWMISVLIYV